MSVWSHIQMQCKSLTFSTRLDKTQMAELKEHDGYANKRPDVASNKVIVGFTVNFLRNVMETSF